MLPLPQVTFDRLAQLIHGLCGLVLTTDKAYLIHHRLEPIVVQSGLRSYDELCDRLRSPALSLLHEQVIDAITTHETSFFRDAQPFEALRQVLLPGRTRPADHVTRGRDVVDATQPTAEGSRLGDAVRRT